MKYYLIKTENIPDEARKLAVKWCEGYKYGNSIMPDIAQKQKLASDITNLTIHVHNETLKKIKKLTTCKVLRRAINNMKINPKDLQ